MNAFDLLLPAAVVAALFLNMLSIVLQKYWRLYTVLFGKKYDVWVHRALISIAWTQVLATLVLAATRGTEGWSQPVIGAVVMAVSAYLLVLSILKAGFGALAQGNFFGRPPKQPAKEQERFHNLAYLAFSCFTLGLSIFSGKGAVGFAAAILMIGVALLTFLERPRR